MAYRVEIAPLALANLEEAYRFIKKESPDRAAKWLDGITQAILSLETLPTRCTRAVESNDVGHEIRRLMYGKRRNAYKVFFAIYPRRPGHGTVRVFHVRSGAMKPLLPDDFKTFIH
jgi:plasmid stabilization system protein ParE